MLQKIVRARNKFVISNVDILLSVFNLSFTNLTILFNQMYQFLISMVQNECYAFKLQTEINKQQMKDRAGLLKPISELKKQYNSVFQANQADRFNESVQKLDSVLSGLNEKMNQRVTQMEQSASMLKRPSIGEPQDNEDILDTEPRFVQAKFRIENTCGLDPRERQQHMKIFAADIARKIISQGFIWFDQGKITDRQQRQYFCNNFIANIVRYSVTNKLSVTQLGKLDEHLKDKVFGFLKRRYPQNQSSSQNRKFEAMITPVDNIQSNLNDLVHVSPVKFQWKQSHDYSKEVMQFINFLLDFIRTKDPNENKNLFQLFCADMEEMFQKVQNEKWMILAQQKIFEQLGDHKFETSKVIDNVAQGGATKDQSRQAISTKTLVEGKKTVQINDKRKTSVIVPEQNIKQELHPVDSRKDKYKKQVKEYTKYAIGQKIPDSVQKFSQKQIDQSNITISNPSVMRILTKWCQQLEKCFQEVNINSRNERFIMQNGEERFLKKSLRQELFLEIQSQQILIQDFVKEVKNNTYENQFAMFEDKNKLNSFRLVASQDEGVAGYFATVMKKSYETYLVSYLNQLIHGILSAQRGLKHKYSKKEYYKMATSLISFKVSDLLRCKCSSKQTEIIALYDYLKHFCSKKPEILEIVRVKNRLAQGTKDILINLFYRKKITVEMQLAINQDTSNFIKCSDKTNHFIYEIERATFGPLSQICNVYTSVDPRAEYFAKQFNALNSKIVTKTNISHCAHEFKESSLPLWCSCCSRFISTLNTFKKNRKCTKCKYNQCSFCYIQESEINSKNIVLNFNNIAKKDKKIIRRKLYIINLEKKKKIQSIVYVVYFNFKVMLFERIGVKNNKIQLLSNGQASNQKELDKLFANKNIVAELQEFFQKDDTKEIQDSLFTGINEEIFKTSVKMVNKKMRKYFVFQELKINDKIFEDLKMQTVQTVNMNNMDITSVKNVVTALPNARCVLINKNKISNLEGIGKWEQIIQLNLEGNLISALPAEVENLKKIKFLLLTNCKFTIFPDQLCKMVNLQRLNFKENQLKNISKDIHLLKNLRNLRLTTNKIKQIPDEVSQLEILEQLDIGQNNIQKLPSGLKNLKCLKIISMQKNNISQVEDDFFKNMDLITKISFKKNKIKKIPSSIQNKNFITNIDFENNELEQIPAFIFKLPNLEQLILSSNKISKINFDKQVNTPKLQTIYLSNNKLDKIPDEIFTITSIQKFRIGYNLLTIIPQKILNLNKIKELSLEKFGFKEFPTILYKMKELEDLNLSDNEISEIPQEVAVFNQMMYEFEIKNNKLTSFPKPLLKWSELQLLNLSGNDIKQIPKEIVELKKLRKIVLEDMHINEIPQVVGQMKYLSSLLLTPEKVANLDTFNQLRKINSKIQNQWKARQAKQQEKRKEKQRKEKEEKQKKIEELEEKKQH